MTGDQTEEGPFVEDVPGDVEELTEPNGVQLVIIG